MPAEEAKKGDEVTNGSGDAKKWLRDAFSFGRKKQTSVTDAVDQKFDEALSRLAKATEENVEVGDRVRKNSDKYKVVKSIPPPLEEESAVKEI